MSSRTSVFRWATRSAAVAAASALVVATLTGAAGAGNMRQGAPLGGNPYSPAVGHSYRHGVMPTIGRERLMRLWASTHPLPASRTSRLNLSYGGGVHRQGVISGHEKVYLIFWGSQWGAQSVDGQGDLNLVGDPSGEAPYLQELFRGLGTGGETWSGVMTQYCDHVVYNAGSCPANSFHVAYPTGGALAGVWADEAAAAPDTANGTQLGAEAVRAARHFGNTTAASNRDAQYVIASATGTHPDGFNTPNGEFCAWHDDSADPNLPAGPVRSTLDLAFTNMPYVTDLGVSCGANFVNAGPAGLRDGMSIVEGHEYAETITDQLPPFGWTNVFFGAENADLCEWNQPDTPGGTNDLTLPTGVVAMTSTWSNDDRGGRCQFRHRVIANNWVLNGGFESGTLGHWVASGPATSVVSASAHSGSRAARLGAPTWTNGSSSIAQTFTARGANFSFWYNVTCPDTVSESWVTATLKDNTAHATVTLLPKTCLAHSGWVQVTDTLLPSHSYTITVINHDDYDPADGSYTLVDDVVDG